MKRSEMLQDIAAALSDEEISFLTSDEAETLFLSFSKAMDMAQKILALVEHKGMMPPWSYKEFYKNWREDLSGYKWEPEDS